MEGHEASF